jgi:hypothetical protein
LFIINKSIKKREVKREIEITGNRNDKKREAKKLC